ncbi:hypothetical protein BALOs_1566 [Halobacteriovorax sp. BALOs_7]|uniref:Uncharacterized protein n=1 Tax=Halobacteriovorax vibrionivorans TaxID=2152716 RepID=A0ABY0IDI2_9BACT|nr:MULTISPECIES: hypothetical protein [Halobacteriovorax]AYF44567.1 hypothetical protein BALOs_1566 [Halobacteriovorax sp. BALOs_7]RZF20655.1 hypothetical protein DAY19_11765 [Halobacteriovorax vibrionivorans]TGD48935.1 hypothetical protein EP118_01965 [Halobacteriovorax sp. Y22]
MRNLTKFGIFVSICLLSATAYTATIDFGTTNYISFRCQVDIFEKKVNPVTYRAYAGRLLNTVFHEQYNAVYGPDIKLLIDLDNDRSLFSNVFIGGNGYLKWSAVETDHDATTIDDATWPVTPRVIYSPRAYDNANNRKTFGESDHYLFRIECFEVKEFSDDYYYNKK